MNNIALVTFKLILRPTAPAFPIISYARTHCRPMATTPPPDRYKLVFFAPPDYLPAIKAAIFATGAGSYPNYAECCFTSHGTGQFRPAAAANPTIGAKEVLEEVEEVRCEILCGGHSVTKDAVAALKKYVHTMLIRRTNACESDAP